MFDKLWERRNIISRSISAENITGQKGMGGMATEGYTQNAARDLGQGWKVAPFLNIPAKTERTIAEIDGSGIIKHIWYVPLDQSAIRTFVLRIYWDNSTEPAVECPACDFFASANREYWQISSLAVCRNPKTGYNSYWEMPFKTHCKVTIENLMDHNSGIAYQIDYDLCDVPADALYFHAQFRRTNPLPYKTNFTILDNIDGKGVYVGTYMVYGIFNNGWWGEGEIKFFLDGDKEFPTICGTGTEDYFCGAYNFEADDGRQYQSFSSPYTGFYAWKTDILYNCTKRFSMYRWHINDSIHFDSDIRVEIQALGWRSNGRYNPMQCDISAVAYFYLDSPAANRPTLPDIDGLEII